MKKRALITGITGQDGPYLARHLKGLGYEVWGMARRGSSIESLGALLRDKSFRLAYGDMLESSTLCAALQESSPDEIYNLAAQSDVGLSFSRKEETMEVNYFGFAKLIEEALRLNPSVRIYQASTSEMFGSTPPPHNELSPFSPVSPYGEAKHRAHEQLVKRYRAKGFYICSGILFSHESPERSEKFVTRKISSSLAKIKLGLQDSFSLGNLDARRDWGFAGDFVKAMHRMLQQKIPSDYVIATGVSHSVREFVESAAHALDMTVSWEGSGLEEVGLDAEGNTILTINKDFYRPAEVNHPRGDTTKARQELGWEPTVSFEELTAMMALADYERLSKNN